MKIHYTNLETCHMVTGLVVVIDVIRAFTNAAIAFSRGAQKIHPVGGVEEALKLKRRIPNALVCGEVGGIPPEGFDFGNSPTQTSELDLQGRVLIQRTSAGTQGIVRSVNSEAMLAASLVVASATVKYIQARLPESVTFVVTGQLQGEYGDEDLACAEYLELLLRGSQPDPKPYINRVYKSRDALLCLANPAFPKSDLDHCTRIDAFDFAMPVKKENDLFAMHSVIP